MTTTDTGPVQLWQWEMAAVQAAFEEKHPFDQGTVRLTDGTNTAVLNVMVASTREQKAQGMIGRDWGDFDGLVFIEPVETTAEFHIRDVTVPIFLALFDADGEFVDQHTLAPGDAGLRIERPFKFALELPESSLAEMFPSSGFTGPVRLEARSFSTEQRKKLASEGKALPDGSYPIVTVGDLKNAIQAVGRASSPGAAKTHIKKRARALGHPELIPAGW